MKSLEELAEEIKRCTKCDLCSSRKNAVPGEGKADAKIMLIGEAPGRNEDETGRPFVGRAGLVLDEALKQAFLQRRDIFVTNVVKCRPPNNRKPDARELDACRDYLLHQMQVIKPSIVITLGLTALQFFNKTRTLKLTPFEWTYKDVNTKVYPTYHPAAVLRGNSLARDSLFCTFRQVAKILE